MVAKKQVKKSATKKIAPKAKVKAVIANPKPIASAQTKTQILQTIAEHTELSVKQVKAVFESTNRLLQSHLMKKGSGVFAVPELALKVVRHTRPASKARQGRNPLTGETMTIAAKPKREVVKVRVLKALKEVLASS